MGRWLHPAVISSLGAALQVLAVDRVDFSELKPCPVRCQDVADSSVWTLYNSVERLTACNEPTIFEVSLSTSLESISDIVAVRACTAGEGQGAFRSGLVESTETQTDFGRVAKRDTTEELCTSPSRKGSKVQLLRWGLREESESAVAESLDLLREVRTWSSKLSGCQSTILLGHLNGTFVGYVGGQRIEDEGVLQVFDEAISSDLESNGVFGRTVLQHCGVSQGSTSSTSAQKDGGGVAAGLVISRDGDLNFVHETMRLWNEAKCVQRLDGSLTDLSDLELSIFPFPDKADVGLEARQTSGTCKTIQVVAGDGCPSLAERCKISGADYTKFNSAAGHCANLKEGQHVCCSAGKLPDVRPKPGADGSCYAYTTKAGDSCSKIAVSNGLTIDELSDLNTKTWGWSGCSPLGLKVTLCLSTGTPPMPAPVDNAVCGPTKPGSRPPRADQTMADLNPCPLNACCNIWGQCGLSDDFCTVQESSTGAPGTSGHRNGCVQNCGMEIVNNGQRPAIFRKLGYFEGWNFNRKCLRMDVERTGRHEQRYTDIHFAFGEISESLDPFIPENQKAQWSRFVKMDTSASAVKVRKVLAFGGWTFSTSPSTYHRFPNAVKPENRVAFARKVVDFAKANNLDGLDFDWEYPGAPDIPGIPAGGVDEGPNYLAFLQEVRRIMPAEMTLSIAAPASYWYLRAFPIGRMAPVLDYIVFMTYDLHGQWDWANKWASVGCPGGNCLRSHVNDTETEAALAMITKAGVPAHKVLVGVATYGRSFKMTTPGCTGPDCTFVGDKQSPAAKGECTNTGGYLALAEIKKIIKENPTASYWIDNKSGSNIMVYNRTEWVAYMDDNIRRSRELKAFRRNFGGTIEWAIDLQDFVETNHGPEGPQVPDPSTRPDWREVKCNHPDLVDASDPADRRWAAARADSAWQEVLEKWWRERNSSPLPFPQYVGNFFNHADKMQCHDLIDVNQCHSQDILCNDDDGNMRPAGWQIIQSFQLLNGMFWNMFQSIERVNDDVDQHMATFKSTFIPPKDSGLDIQLVLDLLAMGYASAMAPLWNKLFAKGRFANNHPGTYDTIKDFTNDQTYQGITVAKDVIALQGVELEEGDRLTEYLRSTTNLWQKTIVDHNSFLFGGERNGTEALWNIIARGNVQAAGSVNANELDALTWRAINAILIPVAWRLADRDFNPFIVDSGRRCSEARDDEVIQRRLSDNAIETELICDPSTDRGYFLVASENPKDNCWNRQSGHNQGIGCLPFPRLPGASAMAREGNEWGITTADIVLGSLATFKANGYKNKEFKPKPDDWSWEEWKTPLDAMQDDAMRAPGLFDLPICHATTAVETSLKKRGLNAEGRGYFFPCEESDPRLEY